MSKNTTRGVRRFPRARALLERESDLLRAVLCSMAADLLEEQLNREPTDEELTDFLSESFND